jgi:adenosylhomocysteine nucleosidase
MIAITFALPAESSGIVSSLRERRDENRIIYGKIASRDVAVFHTGVGRKVCERSMETFLRSVKPDILISSGFAGSLTNQLNIGDLIIGDNFSDRNLATRLMEGGVPAMHSSIQPGSQELAPASKAGIRAVKLVTVDSMIDSPVERRELAERHDADVMDMETDVIARICAAHEIPMVSFRVISDSPAATFPAPPNILLDIARQKTNFGKLVPYVLSHPSVVRGLVRFARQISRVRTILTVAIIEALPKISCQ